MVWYFLICLALLIHVIFIYVLAYTCIYLKIFSYVYTSKHFHVKKSLWKASSVFLQKISSNDCINLIFLPTFTLSKTLYAVTVKGNVALKFSALGCLLCSGWCISLLAYFHVCHDCHVCHVYFHDLSSHL